MSVQASSALFHFSGKSAVKESSIIAGSTQSQNYTANPYGKNGGFGYGGNLQAQFVSKGGFIAGLQAGYEVLRSKVNITGVAPPYTYDLAYLPSANFATVILDAKGTSYLKNNFVNLSPYIGYRLSASKVKIDVMPGVDLAFNVSSSNRGNATTTGDNGIKYTVDRKMDKAPTDVRLKFGAAAIYKRFGLTASYAHGLTNYESKMIGGDFEAHSELIRFGLSYRIL